MPEIIPSMPTRAAFVLPCGGATVDRQVHMMSSSVLENSRCRATREREWGAMCGVVVSHCVMVYVERDGR